MEELLLELLQEEVCGSALTVDLLDDELMDQEFVLTERPLSFWERFWWKEQTDQTYLF